MTKQAILAVQASDEREIKARLGEDGYATVLEFVG
jgi:hypothetical protein